MVEIDNKSQFPHDSFFKESLANINISKDLIKNILPKEILDLINLETLKHEKTNFIDNIIGEKEVDVLFSVDMAEENGYLYALIEHQSTVNRDMSFRLMKYCSMIYDYHKAKHPNDKYLPLIYPFVVYNGVAKYTAPLDFFNLFKNPKLARDLFIRPHQLIDLAKLSDERILSFAHANIMLYMLKQYMMKIYTLL